MYNMRYTLTLLNYKSITNITNKKITSRKKIDLIYPELSYKIIGAVFSVFNEMGYGYQEKYYQKAIAKTLSLLKIPYKEQVPLEVNFRGNKIGRYFLDFLVEDKIILEIKKETNFRRRNIEQVIAYLKKPILN